MTIEEIKSKKAAAGYSNEQIAKLSGLPLSTVQKVLSGTTKAPRRSTILALESVFRNIDTSFQSYGSTNTVSADISTDISADTITDVSTYTDYGSHPYIRPETYSYLREGNAAYSRQLASKDPSAARYPRQGSYTLEDYLALPDDQRVELIDGVFYDMSAPTLPHQVISLEIATALKSYIAEKNGSCMTFIAPTDVQLDCDDRTIVEPDVFVVCDRSKLNRSRVFGAPDLVIEVLSPSTRFRDLFLKYSKYFTAGVREYWIVNPMKEMVTQYYMIPEEEENSDGTPIVTSYTFKDSVPVFIFNNECVIDFKEIAAKYEFMPG